MKFKEGFMVTRIMNSVWRGFSGRFHEGKVWNCVENDGVAL
jgi:hypothetical protein